VTRASIAQLEGALIAKVEASIAAQLEVFRTHEIHLVSQKNLEQCRLDEEHGRQALHNALAQEHYEAETARTSEKP
jgi:hypothetical protein